MEYIKAEIQMDWKTSQHCNDRNSLPLVLLKQYMYRLQALRGCHDDTSYLGVESMLDQLWDRFYWPSMQGDVRKHVQNCEWYFKFKAKPEKAELQHIKSKLVHIDFLTTDLGKGNEDVNITVITD